MKHTLITLLSLWIMPYVLEAQSAGSSSKASHKAESQEGTTNDEFIIGLEDVLSINVWREPEISTPKMVVRPDGKISLPLINEIQASGLTTKQLQDQIRDRLKDFLESPVVNVVVVEIHSQTVYIVGQVTKPGPYRLGSPTTVLELIARAGSFTEFANTKKVLITRKEGNRQVQLHFNYKEFIEGKNLQQNISLRNGDVVVVP